MSDNLEELDANALFGEGKVPPEVEMVRGLSPAEGFASSEDGDGDKGRSVVALFFSFDIVNSTQYKSLTPNWPSVIKHLLDTIVKKVGKEDDLKGARLWRVIGDETVFVLDIALKDQLLPALKAIFRIIQEADHSLVSGSFYRGIPDQQIGTADISSLAANNILSVRATAWSAIVSASYSRAYESVEYRYEPDVSHGGAIVEYLGEDIDVGFRLKEYTRAKRLAISFDLAALLADGNPDADEFLNVIAYRKLKGVWNERLYPIIWLHDRQLYEQMHFIGIATDLKSTFSYDDAENDGLIREYVLRRTGELQPNSTPFIESEMYDVVSAIDKIKIDMGLQQKFDFYQEVFADTESLKLGSGMKDEPLELHCAVVCCDIESREVLVVHRTAEHATNKGKWEFGCAKANPREHLASCMEKHYKVAYGVEIELVMDDSRHEDRQPKPIAVYEVGDVPVAHKGVIFVASAKKSDFRENVNHDRCEWMSKEEAEKIRPEDAVHDFHQTLATVYENFETFFPLG